MAKKSISKPDYRLPTRSRWAAPHAVADGGGGTIIAVAEIAASPERVFQALTTDEVERWWGHPDYYRTGPYWTKSNALTMFSQTGGHELFYPSTSNRAPANQGMNGSWSGPVLNRSTLAPRVREFVRGPQLAIGKEICPRLIP